MCNVFSLTSHSILESSGTVCPLRLANGAEAVSNSVGHSTVFAQSLHKHSNLCPIYSPSMRISNSLRALEVGP